MLQYCDEKDSNSPKELQADFYQSWDKICLLGHQPVVSTSKRVSSFLFFCLFYLLDAGSKGYKFCKTTILSGLQIIPLWVAKQLRDICEQHSRLQWTRLEVKHFLIPTSNCMEQCTYDLKKFSLPFLFFPSIVSFRIV